MGVHRNAAHCFSEYPRTGVLRERLSVRTAPVLHPGSSASRRERALGTSDVGKEEPLLNSFVSICPCLPFVKFAASSSPFRLSNRAHTQTSTDDTKQSVLRWGVKLQRYIIFEFIIHFWPLYLLLKPDHLEFISTVFKQEQLPIANISSFSFQTWSFS